MVRSAILLAAVVVVLSSSFVQAEPNQAEPETVMCQPGKLLLSDDFDQPLAKTWRVPKGRWEIVEGALQGTEIPADMHGAVIRANLKLHNAVIQYSFKLDGAKTTTFSLNDAKGHNSRVLVRPGGFIARKDDHDKAGPDQAAVLQAVQTPISTGQWHTLTIEINGPEFLARLDGKQIAYGTDDSIAVEKTNVGLTVSGESVSFKNLRIWDATPKADWSASRAKLIKPAKP